MCSWDELTPIEKSKIRQFKKRIYELDDDPKNTKRVFELYDEIDYIQSGDYNKNK